MSKDQPIIRVVLDVEGGVVHNIRSTGPIQVIILDMDTEGTDPTHCTKIDNKEAYVTVETPEPDEIDLESTLQEVDNYLDQLKE